MTNWQSLVEQLEQAEGPSRELDARIWAEIDDRDVRVDEQGRMLGRSRTPPHDECVLLDNRFGGPRYTSSIDAALSWMPEQHSFSFSRIKVMEAEDYINNTDGHWQNAAACWPFEVFKAVSVTPYSGANEAISACIAIARARQAMEAE